MLSVYFFLPFILVASVGIYQDSFAETVIGEKYSIIPNIDGSFTWSSHYPYILNPNGEYVPYLFSNGNRIETNHGSIILNSDGSYSFYKKGIIDSDPLFTDKIVTKYADVSNLNSWTYPNSVNNDTPDNSWDGNGFTSSKTNAGVGTLNYKYVLDNGKWKTQLEATNLSGLTTKTFGFDQILDLNRDTIKFGGVIRNLDNFNNTVFNKAFLVANQGKVIDFLNDMSFDFDLGFENLYSVTVIDTGVNKSRLVFDYRTSIPLLPNETLIIDPTFGYATGTRIQPEMVALAGAACSTVGLDIVAGTTGIAYKEASGGAGTPSCYVTVMEYNITTIPDTAAITNVNLKVDIDSKTGTAENCDFTPVTLVQPSTYANTVFNAKLLFDNVTTNTPYINNNAVCASAPSTDTVLDLGTQADADLQAGLSANWFAVGTTYETLTRSGVLSYFESATTDFELEVTYDTTQRPPDKINNLGVSVSPTSSTIGLNWTAPTVYGNQVIIGYQLNVTTPQTNSPLVFINDTGATTTNYNVTGLVFGTDYSSSVSAWTNNTLGHPYNNATSNIYNFTTLDNVFSSIAPTNFLMLPNGTSTSILNMNWTAPVMDSLNGYRIQCEAPVGGGFSTVVSNTTTSGTTYNRTGLVVNTYYNCKVAGLNGTGISAYSNTYSQTTFHLPDAVDDLVATPTDIIDIILTFTQPDTLYGYLTGYNINYTTPQSNDPLTVYVESTGSSDVSYILTGLAASDSYSFRVSAITIHGKNVTGALVANATAFDNFSVGSIVVPTGEDTDPLPIAFEVITINSTTSDLKVTYNSSYDLACDFAYVIGNSNQTYSGLTETAVSGSRVYSNFTLLNSDNDIIDVYCWDQLDNSTNARDRLGQNSTVTPLFDQIGAFQSGAFGTNGNFGALDLMTLILVIVSMIGFNRDHPEVGVAIMGSLIGVCAFYGIIRWETGLTGAVILVVALAIANSKRGSSN